MAQLYRQTLALVLALTLGLAGIAGARALAPEAGFGLTCLENEDAPPGLHHLCPDCLIGKAVTPSLARDILVRAPYPARLNIARIAAPWPERVQAAQPRGPPFA